MQRIDRFCELSGELTSLLPVRNSSLKERAFRKQQQVPAMQTVYTALTI